MLYHACHSAAQLDFSRPFRARSSGKIAAVPRELAISSAVLPRLSCIPGSAPASSSAVAATACPYSAQLISGVRPARFCAFASAPLERSTPIDAVAPLLAAQCKALSPTRVIALWSAPASSSNRTTAELTGAASINGVRPTRSFGSAAAPHASSSLKPAPAI